MGGFDDEEVAHFLPQWENMAPEDQEITFQRFHARISPLLSGSSAKLIRENLDRLGPLVEQVGFAWGFISGLNQGDLDRLVRRRESLDLVEGDIRALSGLVYDLWEEAEKAGNQEAEGKGNPLLSALSTRSEPLVAVAYARVMRLCSESELKCVRLQHSSAADTSAFFSWALAAPGLQSPPVKWQLVAWLQQVLSWSPLAGSKELNAAPAAIPPLWTQLLETGTLDALLSLSTSSTDSMLRFTACSCLEHLALQLCYLYDEKRDLTSHHVVPADPECAGLKAWLQVASRKLQEALCHLEVEHCWRSLDALRAASAMCNVVREAHVVLGCAVDEAVAARLQPLVEAYAERDDEDKARARIRKLTAEELNALHNVHTLCADVGSPALEEFSQAERAETICRAYEIAERQRQGRVCEACEELEPEARRCAGCRHVRYCNADCQREHWPEHKPVCKARARLAGMVAAQQKQRQSAGGTATATKCNENQEQPLRRQVYPAAFVHWLLNCPSAMNGEATEDVSFKRGCVEKADLLLSRR